MSERNEPKTNDPTPPHISEMAELDTNQTSKDNKATRPSLPTLNEQIRKVLGK